MEQKIKLDLLDRIIGVLFLVSIISIGAQAIMLHYHDRASIYAFPIAFLSAFFVISLHKIEEQKRRRAGLPPITGKSFFLPIVIPIAIMIAALIMFIHSL